MKAIGEVTFWRDPRIQGVEICQVNDSKHVFPDHAHDGIYAIGMMFAGGAYCLGSEKSYSLVSPGQIALINPSQVHSGVPLSGERITYRMIYFDMDLVVAATEEVARLPYRLPEFPCMVMGDPQLWQRLQRLCRVMQGPDGQLEKESVLMETMAHLVPFYGNMRIKKATSQIGNESIRHARAFLSENLDRKISLEDVALSAGLSRYHFLRVFKQATGLSPHQYRTLRRIELAKHLLRSGRPTARVALDVGFSDQSHFSNTFRKFTGATPGQYLSK